MNKLVFLYVKDFNDLSPFFLNLCNDFVCQIIDNTLFIQESRNLFKEALGPAVSEINVIAGENGVGKTQLLKLIAELTCGVNIHDYHADYGYVLVHQKADRKFVITNNMDISYYSDPQYQILEEGNAVAPVIYYSPFLDFNPLDINPQKERKSIIDISLSHYVMKDTQQGQKKMEELPAILMLKANNILRQVDFVTHKPVDFKLPFRLPGEVYVRFNRLTPDKDDISGDDQELFDKLSAYTSAFFRDSDRNAISQSVMAKLMFYRNLLSLYFMSVNNNKSQSILHHRFGDGLISEIFAYEGEDPLALLDLYQRFFESDDVFNNGIFERLTLLAFSLIDTEGVSIHFGTSNHNVTLSVQAGDPRLMPLLQELFAPVEHTSNKYTAKELFDFISFDWRNLSSGEKSFLDLCARLYDARKQLKEPSGTVVLLLDEAEVGFHPEWQKKFISYLVLFLNSIFEGYSVQVLIATHSPLVLSDFPKERVHLFRREEEKVEMAPSIGTFAQNIPELLANEFFINTTLIGDFAKAYIDHILQVIDQQNRESLVTKLEEILSRINKIDEPVIKRLLLDSLRQKIDARN